ncbi:MAG: biotin--[acetyl-CoA-carboxylase] ligase, partial [Campylobacterota bacterium]|nr:biotin--[acetyl-CoA-carboxylase] ligase [Campylobacterota bacterium]
INHKFGYLDIEFDLKKGLKSYFDSIDKKVSWKHIFSKYSIEFKKSRDMKTTIGDKKVLLSGAILNNDGSIFIDNKKVFSLR